MQWGWVETELILVEEIKGHQLCADYDSCVEVRLSQSSESKDNNPTKSDTSGLLTLITYAN